jgi:hypothetical protein
MIRPNAPAIYPCPHGATVIPTRESIPPITDPMGRHWQQPDLTSLDISGDTVELTQREFDALMEYSTTLPSGVYPGKCWKAEGMDWPKGGGFPKATGIWYLRWFGECDDPKKCSNNQRVIRFINERKEAA